MLGPALLLLGLLAPQLASAATPVERHGQLRVAGNRIVDRHGDPVVLRGMSFFWSQWAGDFYNRATVDHLVDDWKVDVVRAAMAVHSGGYLEHPERERRKVEALVEAAVARGIYVIVDWHAHQPEPAAAGAFFEWLAAKYGHLPNLIYETYNEPLREHGWRETVKLYHLAVIPRIRAHDPDNLIIAGTPTWSQDVDIAARDPLPFTNVAYTLHFYAGTHGEELRAKARAALAGGVALMVTEWGTSEADGNGILAVAETRRWWRFLEEQQLSYLAWSVSDKPETSAALRPGASRKGGWTDAMLTPGGALIRAHLREMHDSQARPPQRGRGQPEAGSSSSVR
ncbi:cellulase family glycosylhydrolase [Sphingomonas xinjiangensis]|uniref:Endoglucanase n=1 Tax=Sphingomonas xinjiangensis TaxID=643568 RepID=A0A840YSJ9_9SPHN|nr:endoglucanase [Sphingomonas xinjiangensis]